VKARAIKTSAREVRGITERSDILSEPIKMRVLEDRLAMVRARGVDDEVESAVGGLLGIRLLALCQKHGVDPTDSNAGWQLALALAFEHVTGFRLETRGRPKKRQRGLKLVKPKGRGGRPIDRAGRFVGPRVAREVDSLRRRWKRKKAGNSQMSKPFTSG